MILQMDSSVVLRVHLKYVLEAFMEVCVTLVGIKKLPRLCATTSLEVAMVSNLYCIDVSNKNEERCYDRLQSI